jgi:predicted site-specific integrase-resolvase
MKQLLLLIGEQTVDVVLIEYPVRLVHFGFGYLEQAFGWKDVRLEVLDPPKHQEPTEELIGGHVDHCHRVCRATLRPSSQGFAQAGRERTQGM